MVYWFDFEFSHACCAEINSFMIFIYNWNTSTSKYFIQGGGQFNYLIMLIISLKIISKFYCVFDLCCPTLYHLLPYI